MSLLINKLFSSKKKTYGKHQDVRERAFSFTKEQVRIVLFRECDFRGRKLLFDSQSVQRVPVTTGMQKQCGTSTPNLPNKHEVYVEISNGYGYQYTRPSADTTHLGEMVFGSVAMSFRGSYFKIHSFSSPPKLMCTQVFPSPRVTCRSRVSVTSGIFPLPQSNSSTQSLDKSGKLDYSSASSTTSFNENASGQSTDSDIRIIPGSTSGPLDVPLGSSIGYKLPSLEADSGFCGEQSYSSVSSGPISAEQFQGMFFSYGSLGKRCLRSASTSLDHTSISRDSSLALGHSSASADDCMLRGHQRSSKLGLAVILQLSHQQEVDMEKFLLRHAALVEAAVGRARAGAEAAYTRPASFASLMYDIHTETCRWFTDLLTGPFLNSYLWHSLSKTSPRIITTPTVGSWQDLTKTKSETNLSKVNSVSDFLVKRTKNNLFSTSSVEVNNSLFDSSLRTNMNRSFSGLTRSDIFINKHSLDNLSVTSPQAENFVKDLCELLETIDVKHTNFFISTLLTAVLTHHLGWVSTVCEPSAVERELASKLPSTCNPLWGQLTDLYGAVGHPARMSRTIVCGSNKTDIITRILNMLTYFIRCSSILRNTLRDFSFEDLSTKETTIQPPVLQPVQTSTSDKMNIKIPSFKEMHPTSQNNEQLEMTSLKLPISKSCLTIESTLKLETKSENNIESLKSKDTHKSKSLEKTLRKNKSVFGNLCLQAESLSNNNLTHTLKYNNNNTIESMETLKKAKCSFETNPEDSNVIFVLGENEKLVGLKKTPSLVKQNEDTESQKDLLNIPSSSNTLKRPTELKLPTKVLFSCSSDSSPDCDSTTSPCGDACQATTDLSPCSECEKMRARSGSLQSRIEHPKIVMTRSATIDLEIEFIKDPEIRRREGFDRSQSVPPSDKKRKCSKSGCKKKYSGVKFDMRQYPQIVTNYMKSKYLELSQLPFGEKASTLNRSFSLFDSVNTDIPACDCEPNSEALQTPSNASELEFTSDLDTDKYESHHSTSNNLINIEIREDCDESSIDRNDKVIEHPLQEKDNAMFEHDIEEYEQKKEVQNLASMVYVDLPVPSIDVETKKLDHTERGYTSSLLRGVSTRYTPDMVLQGVTSPPNSWETALRRDLQLSAKRPLLDQPVQEAVAIVADTDTWEVQLVSSHSYVIERGCAGVRVCLSQLVANMLDSLLQMWKLRTPSEYCLMHIETRLREMCLQSKALAQLLLNTEFCSMEALTSAMQLEVNDIPLLMAVASTHTPQVTHKYGLSFQ